MNPRLINRQRFLILFLLVMLFCQASAGAQTQTDPFKPFLTEQSPQIVREIGEEVVGEVSLRRVVFLSRQVETAKGLQSSEVFALIARPKIPGRYPGLLVLHGGAGSAEQAKATAWAARGYIVVAPDLPGISDPKKVPNSKGPWKEYKFEDNFIAARPSLTSGTFFDGVLAALQSFYLLRAQPDVIDNRLGIVGVSLGGYSTTMVCGLAGSKVRAAFSVYGSGYYDLGSYWLGVLAKLTPDERNAWLKYMDAGRRAKDITAHYFLAAAANDTYFWPPAVAATLAEIPAAKNQLYVPNADHWAPVPGGSISWTNPTWLEMERPYFDYYLKGAGHAFPIVALSHSPHLTKSGVRVRFHVEGDLPLRNAAIYYSLQSDPWMKRKWLKIKVMPRGKNNYVAVIPKNVAAQGINFYALVTDTRPVSVSSPMVSVVVRDNKMQYSESASSSLRP